MGTLADKLQYLKDTKDAIMNAIIEKGVAIPLVKVLSTLIV